MRWFYDVKKRKTIIGVFLFSVFTVSTLLYTNFNSMGNGAKTVDSGAVQPTHAVESTMALQSPEIKITPTVIPTSTATSTAMPTTTPTATPTAMTTTTPTTPTTMPTATATPTIPVITPTMKVTATPTKAKATPTITLKPTPKKTVQNKTKKPVKTLAKPTATKVESKFELKYKNGNANANTDSIYPMFKIINSGNQSLKLSNVKIRYYYTKEDNKPETFWCDSFSKGATNVNGSFVSLSNKKSTADSYLEISFSDTAGELKAGESAELSVGFAKNDWSEYAQKNDYSYSTSRAYFSWNKVTLYVWGKLASGIEP